MTFDVRYKSLRLATLAASLTVFVAVSGCDSQGNLIAADPSRESTQLLNNEESVQIQTRIANGSDDTSDAVRNAVVLISTGCTGTLVAPNLVLTAAHCGFLDNRYYTGGWSSLVSPVTVWFGPDRSTPSSTIATANQISAPPLRTGGPSWQEDIVLLRLSTNVPARVAVPRPVYLDHPEPLLRYSWLPHVIYQIGYGGSRDRRIMTGRSYTDWQNPSFDLQTNAFKYTADNLGVGTRGTNIENGDSGGPMTLNSDIGPVMGVLSHWSPTGIATYGPGGDGRPSIRNWLRSHLPTQHADLEVVSIEHGGCTGSGGNPMIAVTVKNKGAITRRGSVNVFTGRASAPRIGEVSTMNRWSHFLAPEETQRMAFEISDGFSHGWIDVLLDTEQRLTEINELNNHKSRLFGSMTDCSFN